MVHNLCRDYAYFVRWVAAVFLLKPIFCSLEYVDPTSDVIVDWLPNDPDNPAAYSGYCAHPPIQQTTVSTPLTDDEKSWLGDAKLVGLQVIFRHGARIPTSPLKHCFNVPNYTMDFDCGIQRVFREESNAIDTTLELEEVYPKRSGHCGTGRLQDEAKYQFQALANTLKEKYDFQKLGITPKQLSLRADEVPRTQASMYLLVSNLFPDAGVQRLHLAPLAVDPWTGNPNCPEMIKARSALAQVASLPIIPGHADNDDSVMSQRWADVTGISFNPIKAKDCLTEAVCTPQPLPPGFTKDLFDWALYKSLKAQRMKYSSKSVVSKVLGSQVVFDLQDMFEAQTKKERDESTPVLALYSTHDTTIIQLLVALDLWDGQWPMYAETTILEAYQAITPSGKVEASFRLLRRGKPLAIAACEGRTVCSADVLAILGMPELRDAAIMDSYCFGDQTSRLSSERGTQQKERLSDGQDAGARSVLLSYYSVCALLGVVVTFSTCIGFLIARWCIKPIKTEVGDDYVAAASA